MLSINALLLTRSVVVVKLDNKKIMSAKNCAKIHTTNDVMHFQML